MVDVCMEKIKTIYQIDWSSLLSDLQEMILKRLSYKDKLMFQATCSSWHSVAKPHVKSFLIEVNGESPLLLIPTNPKEKDINKNEMKKNNYLFNVMKRLQKPLNMPVESHCIGSSKGWLIFVKEKLNLFMYNPLLDLKFNLPCIVSLAKDDYDLTNLRNHWVRKAIVWGDPIRGNFYGIAIIYGKDLKIAYANHEDPEWTQFEHSDEKYRDIIACEDTIYTLSKRGRNITLESWYSNCLNPAKTAVVNLSFPAGISENQDGTRELFSLRSYIVESKNNLLLVIRCIGDHKYFCDPYLTKNFYVYKVDVDNEKWIKVKDLNDQMLFVGGNESKSLLAKDYEGCRENSIYFTDDYWCRIENDGTCGGHDMGVFNLCNGYGSVQEIYDCKVPKMTPAIWVIQN